VELGPPEQALASGSEWATQIGRLLPGGPVTVPAALELLRGAGAGAGADADEGADDGRSDGAGGPGAATAAEVSQ
jgi:hypothetical protein